MALEPGTMNPKGSESAVLARLVEQLVALKGIGGGKNSFGTTQPEHCL